MSDFPPPESASAPPLADATVAPPAPTSAPPHCVGLTTTLGLALAEVISAQVLAAISEGMALKGNQPQGVPGDILHRLGYPFGTLGASSALYLILAAVFVTL